LLFITPLLFLFFVIEREKGYLWREMDRSQTICVWTLGLAFGGFILCLAKGSYFYYGVFIAY